MFFKNTILVNNILALRNQNFSKAIITSAIGSLDSKTRFKVEISKKNNTLEENKIFYSLKAQIPQISHADQEKQINLKIDCNIAFQPGDPAMYKYILGNKDKIYEDIKDFLLKNIKIKINNTLLSQIVISINELKNKQIKEIEIEVDFTKIKLKENEIFFDILKEFEPILILNADLTNEDNSIIDKPLILNLDFDERKLFDKSKIIRECELFKRENINKINFNTLNTFEELKQYLDVNSFNNENSLSNLTNVEFIRNNSNVLIFSFEKDLEKYLFIFLKQTINSDEEIKCIQNLIQKLIQKQKEENKPDIQIIYQKKATYVNDPEFIKKPKVCRLFKQIDVDFLQLQSEETRNQYLDLKDIKEFFYNKTQIELSSLKEFEIIQNDNLIFISSFEINSDKYLFIFIKKNDLDINSKEINQIQESIRKTTLDKRDFQIIYQKKFIIFPNLIKFNSEGNMQVCNLFKVQDIDFSKLENEKTRNEYLDLKYIKEFFYKNKQIELSNFTDFKIIQNDTLFFISSFKINSDKYLFIFIKKNSNINLSFQEKEELKKKEIKKIQIQEIKKFQKKIKQIINNQDDIQIIYQKPFYDPYQIQTYSSLHFVSEHLLNKLRTYKKGGGFIYKTRINWVKDVENEEWNDDVSSIFEKKDAPDWQKSYNILPRIMLKTIIPNVYHQYNNLPNQNFQMKIVNKQIIDNKQRNLDTND